jgi:hypothetical protein
MLGEEEALHLGYHQFNLECIEPGSVFLLHKNVFHLKILKLKLVKLTF